MSKKYDIENDLGDYMNFIEIKNENIINFQNINQTRNNFDNHNE